MRVLSLAAVLFGFWLLLSGHYTPFLIGAGLIVSLVVAGVGLAMGYTDEEGHPIELLLNGLAYWPWLIKEIMVSAINVSSIILKPSLPISPRLVEFDTLQEGSVGTVTYANSITLTPGTITVRVLSADRKFIVHALTKEAAEGLLEGEMDRRVHRMAGKA